jgi:hypothetical protein
MERSEWECKDGNTWARQADDGRPGMGYMPVWVLLMWAPSGRLMAMMVVAGVIAVRSLVTLKKWHVAPESIISGGEGVEVLELIMWLILFKLLACSLCSVVPLVHC